MRRIQTWLASQNCTAYPSRPDALEYNVRRRCRSFVYSKIQSIAVKSWYPTLRPGPSTYQSRGPPSFKLLPTSLPIPTVFNPNSLLVSKVGVPPRIGEGVACREFEPFPEIADRNREPAVCLCFRLNDTISSLSASSGSSVSKPWSPGELAASLSLSSSIVAGLGGLRLEEDEPACSNGWKYPADELAIFTHLRVVVVGAWLLRVRLLVVLEAEG